MAKSLNKVQLIGNLGKDPELRQTESGVAVCTFSLATNESWVDKSTGEKHDQTEWHRVVVWRGLAEVCGKYLHKGKSVYLEGKLQTRSYEKDGQTLYTTEIVANQMIMLGDEGERNGPGAANPTQGKSSGHGFYEKSSGSGKDFPDDW